MFAFGDCMKAKGCVYKTSYQELINGYKTAVRVIVILSMIELPSPS